jgi:hypothetical protein
VSSSHSSKSGVATRLHVQNIIVLKGFQISCKNTLFVYDYLEKKKKLCIIKICIPILNKKFIVACTNTFSRNPLCIFLEKKFIVEIFCRLSWRLLS